jgi:hypothetical protein
MDGQKFVPMDELLSRDSRNSPFGSSTTGESRIILGPTSDQWPRRLPVRTNQVLALAPKVIDIRDSSPNDIFALGSRATNKSCEILIGSSHKVHRQQNNCVHFLDIST